ncbi:hypothetical protein [Alkalihalobacillus sp. BA299]|uniref:hypothetical protein n=1 Tax=Alkalihalobacillus sp. BA299 TaxID=2815938 RepID=UPI001ADADDAF|nr:hypothetical protein [Alkalihalobacillus sp. BA299]
MSTETNFVLLIRSAFLANIALLMTFLLMPILLLTDNIHLYKKLLKYMSYDSRFDNHPNLENS